MDAVDADLRRRTWHLLQPGEVELDGLIVATDVGGGEEAEMHQLTVEVGETIADHVVPDQETWVYSGNDDPEFASNQHQGLTMADEFVWECQQLLRDGSFDLVFYYPAEVDHESILADLRGAGHRVIGVRGDVPLERQELARQDADAGDDGGA